MCDLPIRTGLISTERDQERVCVTYPLATKLETTYLVPCYICPIILIHSGRCLLQKIMNTMGNLRCPEIAISYIRTLTMGNLSLIVITHQNPPMLRMIFWINVSLTSCYVTCSRDFHVNILYHLSISQRLLSNPGINDSGKYKLQMNNSRQSCLAP